MFLPFSKTYFFIKNWVNCRCFQFKGLFTPFALGSPNSIPICNKTVPDPFHSFVPYAEKPATVCPYSLPSSFLLIFFPARYLNRLLAYRRTCPSFLRTTFKYCFSNQQMFWLPLYTMCIVPHNIVWLHLLKWELWNTVCNYNLDYGCKPNPYLFFCTCLYCCRITNKDKAACLVLYGVRSQQFVFRWWTLKKVLHVPFFSTACCNAKYSLAMPLQWIEL